LSADELARNFEEFIRGKKLKKVTKEDFEKVLK
jgi:hypothetical protein